MKLLALVIAFLSLAAQATLFEDLAASYHVGSYPAQKGILGTWSGRCVDAKSPDTQKPAILIHKVVADTKSFPQNHQALTYYVDQTQPADYFDSFSDATLATHAGLQSWLTKEQWNAASNKEDALTSVYHVNPTTDIVRSLKIYEDEFNQTMVLKVSREEFSQFETKTDTYRYCFFVKEIAPATEPTEPVTPVETKEYELGKAGVVQNQWVSFINPFQGTDFDTIQIKHLGGNSILSGLRIIMEDGTVWDIRQAYQFAGFGLIQFSLPKKEAFRIRVVQFYVSGVATGLVSRAFKTN